MAQYELTHDTIARQVFDKASTEARTRRKVERYVRERYAALHERGAKLTQDDIDFVTPYLGQVNISSEEMAFVEQGRQDLTRKRRVTRILVGAIIALLLFLTVMAIANSLKATENEAIAIVNAQEALDAKRQDSLRAIDLGLALVKADSATLRAEVAQRADSLKAIELGLALSEANLQRLAAERRTLELQARSLAEEAANLPREEREVALRLAQEAYEMCASPPALVKKKLAEIFYRQLGSEEHVAEPLPMASFIRERYSRFCDAQYSPDGQYVLVDYGPNLALFHADGQLIWKLPDAGQTWAVQFAPNSQWIAFPNQEVVEVWSVDQQHITTLEGHETLIQSITFSPDSKKIVTCAMNDSIAKVWGLDGRFLFNLNGHHGQVYSSAFSADGEFIATASEDRTVIIWDSEGQFVTQLPDHEKRVTSIQFSPNKELLFTTAQGQVGRLWNTEGDLVATFDSTYNVDKAQFSPDGEKILTSEFRGNISLWDLDGNLLSTFDDCRGTISALGFSPDGRLICAASSDDRAKVWDLANKHLLLDLIHRDGVNSIQFSQDGKQVLTSSRDGTARIWPFVPPLFVDLNFGSSQVEFSSDGKSFITTGGSTARLWSSDGVLLRRMDDTRYVHFLPDTKQLLTYGLTTAFIRDLSGKPLLEWPNPDSEYFNNIVVSPNEQLFCDFYFRGAGEPIRIFNSKGKVLSQWQAHEKKTTSVAFSPDNQLLLTVSMREEARLWDLKGQLLLQLKFDGQFRNAVFSPDGRYIAAYETYGPVRILNLAGDVIATTAKGANYSDIQFSTDGKYLAISDKATLMLWDMRSMSIKIQIPQTADIHFVQFSPDGQRVLTTPGGKSIAVWNLRGELIAEFEGHSSGLNIRAVFSPDGDYILSTSDDETVKRWPLPERIYDYLKNEAAIPELTAEQRERYGI